MATRERIAAWREDGQHMRSCSVVVWKKDNKRKKTQNLFSLCLVEMCSVFEWALACTATQPRLVEETFHSIYSIEAFVPSNKGLLAIAKPSPHNISSEVPAPIKKD